MRTALGIAAVVIGFVAPVKVAAVQDVDAPAAVSPADDHEQALREAFELLDDADWPAALRAMQRVAVRAPAETLAKLNAWTRTVRGTALDELMAETRMRVVRNSSRGKTFDLRYATPFEGDALGRRLERLADECLNAEFSGKAVAIWARQPESYRELRADAADLESKARMAAGVIGARLRYDPRVRGADRTPPREKPAASRRTGTRVAAAPPADARGELVRLGDDLARLAAHVRSLPGFTALTAARDDPDDPTLRTAERLEAERVEREKADAERDAADRPEAESQPATQPASTSRPASKPSDSGE